MMMMLKLMVVMIDDYEVGDRDDVDVDGGDDVMVMAMTIITLSGHVLTKY